MKLTDDIEAVKSSFSVLAETHCCGQTTLEVKIGEVKAILSHFKNQIEPGYEVLMDLTGIDYLHPEPHTVVSYLLHNPTHLQRLFVHVRVKREETIPSVTDLWEGADWYERELFDMFGVRIEGHPDMKRILMPDDWKGHPLRRDYPLTEESVAFKHGVEPKVPSQIIPYVQCHKKNS